DLDIDTLELLEELLEDYTGTVFLVSHDRTFLDNVVTQVIVAEGDGMWREYIGGYTDWERVRRVPLTSTAPKLSKGTDTKAAASENVAPRQKKLSYKEQRELDALPALIAQLEAEQQAISAKLADPDSYKQSADELARLHKRFAALDAELMEALEKWEQIEARGKA
ncbi:MAG: ABC transporter ATP-binding protein, partial [Pseudomonadota bacterium]|nr:ABC transporter ATP-binding protein [Pseudomonadota bacterium]